jgi:hypothetical protein
MRRRPGQKIFVCVGAFEFRYKRIGFDFFISERYLMEARPVPQRGQ